MLAARRPAHRLVSLAQAAPLAVALLLFSAVRTVHAQVPDQLHTASPEELAVVKVLLAQQNAWNSGNLKVFLDGYKDSPQTLFLGSSVLHGLAEISNDYRRNYPSKESMGTLTYSDFEVRIFTPSFAACTGKYHVDRSKKAGGSSEGLFSVVMEKTSDGWKIVLDHTT
jgi:ketosteroid isomerase-like protein